MDGSARAARRNKSDTERPALGRGMPHSQRAAAGRERQRRCRAATAAAMSEKPIILVFQMAKVASLSWYEAITAADPHASVFHLHFASELALDFIRSLGRETAPTQTIRRPALLLRLGTLPAALA